MASNEIWIIIMEIFNDYHELRRWLRHPENCIKPLENSETHQTVFDHLNCEKQWLGLDWFVYRLDSVHNFYKVESHMILTKMLLLSFNFDVVFSFNPASKHVIFQDTNGEHHYIEWHRPECLMKITWLMMESTKFDEDFSYAYSDYRHATRAITDHLSENHVARDTWVGILNLTKDYYRDNLSVDV